MTERILLDRNQSRKVDQLALEKYGMTGLVLMENAGRGCAELLLRHGPQKAVILCGGGNNGGDGLVIARHLDRHQVPVEVVLLKHPEQLTGDALENFKIVDLSGISYRYFGPDDDLSELLPIWQGADWVVDAMLGTGATGDPRPPVSQLIQFINQHAIHALAIDIPSGLDCETGIPGNPTIRATITATMVSWKTGFAQPEAKACLGEVNVVDIGVPRALLEEVFAKAEKSGR